MRDTERLLLARYLSEKKPYALLEEGLDTQHFKSNANREVFKKIKWFVKEYGETPSKRWMRDSFPDFNLDAKDADPIPVLAEEMRHDFAHLVLRDALDRGLALSDDERVGSVEKVLRKALEELDEQKPQAYDVDITRNGAARLKRYEDRVKANKDGAVMLGIESGFRTLDEVTLGWQPGQLVTYVGLPKSGKSTTLLVSAKKAFDTGYMPLYVGFEMSNYEQEERLDSMFSGVSYTSIRKGLLKKSQLRTIRERLEELEQSDIPFMLSTDSNSVMTISGIRAKIARYRPDIVFIDGVYMMEDENGERKGTPQALTNITRSLKRLAVAEDIPICMATQALSSRTSKAKGITDNSIGYSSSFVQDSDYVLGIDISNEETGERRIKIVASRSSPLTSVVVHWNWDNGTFEEYEEAET